jgi:hypothetical protein
LVGDEEEAIDFNANDEGSLRLEDEFEVWMEELG